MAESKVAGSENGISWLNKLALWMLLELYELKGKCLEIVMNLHETSEYNVLRREGVSEAWIPARGLKEGCSLPSILL